MKTLLLAGLCLMFCALANVQAWVFYSTLDPNSVQGNFYGTLNLFVSIINSTDRSPDPDTYPGAGSVQSPVI